MNEPLHILIQALQPRGFDAPLPDLVIAPDRPLGITSTPRAVSLLRCLAGLEPPQAGTLHFPESPRAAPRDRIWLDSGVRLLSTLSLQENLMLPAHYHGCDRSLVATRMEHLFPRGIPEGDKLPEQADPLTQRQVLIARSLIIAPTLLVLHGCFDDLEHDRARTLLSWTLQAAGRLGSAVALSARKDLLSDDFPGTRLDASADPPILLHNGGDRSSPARRDGIP